MNVEPVTRWLERAQSGDSEAMNEVMRIVAADLEAAAERHLRARYGSGLAGATLEPAALVNETYLQLLKQRSGYRNRAHFLAIATRVMLRVLADYERGKRTVKRGAGQVRVTLNGLPADSNPPDALFLDRFGDALDRLEAQEPRCAEVAKLGIVWGFTSGEIADALSVSTRTVDRDLRFARAWLSDELALVPP